MTAASYATNLVEIIGDTQTNSTSNWSALGGGASALNAGTTENFIEQAQAFSKDAFGSNRKGFIYNTGSDQGGSGTDGAYSFWVTFASPPSLDTKAGAGLDVLIGSSASAYEHYHVHGSDTFPFGGWQFCAVNEDTAGDETTGSPTAGVEQTFGLLCDATAAGAPSKGETTFLDTVREGRHDIVITNGTTPDAAATFDGVMSNLETSTNRWGLLVQKEPGGPFDNSGLIQFGTSGTQVRFTDSDKVIFIRDHDHVTANFHTWECNNASSVITMTNMVVKALGTTSPGRWVTNNNPTINLTTCQFIDMGVFGFGSNSTIDTCTFNGCDTVSPVEADMAGSSFLSPSVAADGAAVSWDETISTTHTISELDNTTFEMGANNHHAVSFSTNVSNGANITLRNINFNGFDADGTGDSDNSIIELLATTGTITITLEGCKVDGAAASDSNFTVDTRAGCSVVLVFDTVTTLLNVKDNEGNNEQDVQVWLQASDGTGDLPYQQAITSISQAAGSPFTRTVTFTAAHGLKTNDYLKLAGITNATQDNSGAFQVTVTSPTVCTYVGADTGETSFTGTITGTGGILYGATDASGNISASRTWGGDQPYRGQARKSTNSPRFKTIELAGSISSSVNTTINRRLVLDE